jgi:hypothetical protein
MYEHMHVVYVLSCMHLCTRCMIVFMAVLVVNQRNTVVALTAL